MRRVEGGRFTSLLGSASIGRAFTFLGPRGYFTFHPSPRPALFIATGTGVAPFLSMALARAGGFTLLHGVHSEDDLYYRETFRASAGLYVPCVTAGRGAGCFMGTVSQWVRTRLPPGIYDFYLCGWREMIRDVTMIVDEQFPGSRIYTEIFH